MTEFGELIAQPGERHLIYGGTRAGKSSFIDWQIRHIQATRPDCMQILLDTKPRFRAETERGAFGPKADAAPRGVIVRGARVRQSLTPFLLICTRNIHFADCGHVPEKSPSCNPAKKMTGERCSYSVAHLCVRKSETGSDTYTLTKCLTSTDGRHTAS